MLVKHASVVGRIGRVGRLLPEAFLFSWRRLEVMSIELVFVAQDQHYYRKVDSTVINS